MAPQRPDDGSRKRGAGGRLGRPDPQALSNRLFAVLLLVAVALVLAVGLPALAVTDAALSRQLALRADQGESAARALWSAEAARVEALIGLAAQRPTLRLWLADGDPGAIEPYLEGLRQGMGLDGLVVRDASGKIVGRSPVDAQEPLLERAPRDANGSGTRSDAAAPALRDTAGELSVALAARSTIGPDQRGEALGWVDLDADFLADLERRTGVGHALYVDGRPIAAAMPGLPHGLDERDGSAALPSGEHLVRAVPLDLQGHRLTDVLLVSAEPVQSARRRVSLLLAAGALGALLPALALAYAFARNVTRPLHALIGETERLGRGDLSRSVSVVSPVREVASLAGAFELMRQRVRTAHEALREAQVWSEGLVASLAEGVITVDEGGRITSFSAGAERILGWRAGEVIGRSWHAVLGGDPAGDAPPSFVHTRPGTVARRTTTAKDGRALHVAISSGGTAPERDAGSERVYVMRDVTEEERAMRQREHLLASLSHELQTPLASLRAGAEILQAATTDPDLAELARSMLVSTRRLGQLVDNLLSSARIHAGSLDVDLHPTDLVTVLEEVVLEMAPVFASRAQWVDVRGTEDVPDVLADPRRMTQVLVNLLSNASRHAPPGRPILLRVHTDPERVRVDVIDEGPGIPDEMLPDLFEPFAPGGASRSAGVGLGLSIAQAIVQRHGGTLVAANSPGGGARFGFDLKRSDA